MTTQNSKIRLISSIALKVKVDNLVINLLLAQFKLVIVQNLIMKLIPRC